MSDFDLEPLTNLPVPKPGYRIYAINGRGEIRDLTTGPQLTWGERLLGTFRTFYQLRTQPFSVSKSFEALSGTGRHRFQIKLDMDFRLTDPEAFIRTGSDPGGIAARLKRECEQVATRFSGQEYLSLRDALMDKLAPGKSIQNTTYDSPFTLLDLAVSVEPPSGLDLITDESDVLEGMKVRLAASLARGETQKAAAYQNAIDYIESGGKTAASTKEKATRVLEIERVLSDLRAETGMGEDSEVYRALKAELTQIATAGVDPKKLERSDKAGSAPKDVPNDAD